MANRFDKHKILLERPHQNHLELASVIAATDADS